MHPVCLQPNRRRRLAGRGPGKAPRAPGPKGRLAGTPEERDERLVLMIHHANQASHHILTSMPPRLLARSENICQLIIIVSQSAEPSSTSPKLDPDADHRDADQVQGSRSVPEIGFHPA